MVFLIVPLRACTIVFLHKNLRATVPWVTHGYNLDKSSIASPSPLSKIMSTVA